MSESTEKTPIRGRFATPDEESWHAYRRQSEQETPKRLEEAAKYLSGLVSLVFAIFTARKEGIFRQDFGHTQVLLGLCCLLLSVAAALFVIFPLRWRQVSQSAADIERVHRASVGFKYALLAAGVGFFLLGLGLLGWVFVWG
jgi:hypothetical protein